MEEIWKDVTGFEDKLRVSSRGNISSKVSGKELKPSLDGRGFLETRVKVLGKKKTLKIHNLVAKEFLAIPDGLIDHARQVGVNIVVRHLDGDKKNNVSQNLSYELEESIVGQRFGKLLVTKLSNLYIKPSDGKREKRWLCVCDCGGSTETSQRKLETGHTTSCGCTQRVRGGKTKTEEYGPSYSVWKMVMQRCTNPNFVSNAGYYGRVSVCSRWQGDDGFDNFLEDMGVRPSMRHTIERVDVNGDYTPDNCIWTDDYSLQAFNQRLRKSNTSGKTGVLFSKDKGVWLAFIRKLDNKKSMTFSSFEEAARQRDAWELELYGFNKDNKSRE